MARDFVALVGAHEDDASDVLESTGGLLLLGMIIMSLSIISMVIFACADGISKSKIRGYNGGEGGGVVAGGGGGCGGGGGGGGG